MSAAPASAIARAAATRPAPGAWIEPAWNDSGLTFRTPMTATGNPSPRERPARLARATELRGSGGFLERAGAEDARDLLAVEGLALEQRAGERVELLDVLPEDLPGAGGGVHHDALDLRVDEERGGFAVVLGPSHLAPEEDVLLVLAEGERAELVGHAPLADHLARHLGRLLEVVAGTRGLLLENDLLGAAPAQQDGDPVDQVLPRVVVLVVERQLLGEPERAAARDDRHLVHGVGARQEVGDERVARLVVGDNALLGVRDDHRAPLHTHQDLVLGVLEVGHLDDLLVLPRREERRLVDEVGEVGAREARRAAREHLQLDGRRQRNPPRVDPQDLLAALHVRPRHDHLPVEAAGTQQRGVEDVRPVRRGDEDDALVGLEPVHLDEELVQGLLTLVVAAAKTRAPVPPDRVDLVHEDDAGRVLLALLEQVAHARGADAHEHLHEVRARDREERHVGLAGDRLREQRLAGAGRPDEKDALGDLAAELLELLRVLQEIDDLAQLFLGLVDPRDVLERHLVLLVRDEAGPRLAEAERLRATALHLAHEEDPHADEEEHRHPLQHGRVPRDRVGRLHGDAHAAVLQRLDEVGVLDDVGPLHLRGVLERVRDVVAADHDGLHAPLVHGAQELGEVRLLLPALVRALEDGEQQDDDQADHHPEREILVHLVHPRPVYRDLRYGTLRVPVVALNERVTPSASSFTPSDTLTEVLLATFVRRQHLWESPRT